MMRRPEICRGPSSLVMMAMRGSVVAALFGHGLCACGRIVVGGDANVDYGIVGDAIDDVLIYSWDMMTEDEWR